LLDILNELRIYEQLHPSWRLHPGSKGMMVIDYANLKAPDYTSKTRIVRRGIDRHGAKTICLETDSCGPLDTFSPTVKAGEDSSLGVEL
jgi:hypothetical protein